MEQVLSGYLGSNGCVMLVVVVSIVRNRTRRVKLPVLTTTSAPAAVNALTAARLKPTPQDRPCSAPLCYYPVMVLVIPTSIARSLREG